MRRNLYLKIIEINNQTLAGVPSVVFGLLGLTIFVYALHLESIVRQKLTMSLLVLPTVVVASQEAIRSVPSVLLEGSYGLGAEVANDVSNCIAICFPRDYNGLYVSDIKSNWRSRTTISYWGTCVCKLCSI